MILTPIVFTSSLQLCWLVLDSAIIDIALA
jgi:hypothetical protein